MNPFKLRTEIASPIGSAPMTTGLANEQIHDSTNCDRAALFETFLSSLCRFMVTSLTYMHRHVGECVEQAHRTHFEKQAVRKSEKKNSDKS